MYTELDNYNSMYHSELSHSAKGTSWEKKNHKYKKKVKVNGVWKYVYFDEKDLSEKEKRKLRQEESRINKEGNNYNVRSRKQRDREHEQYMNENATGRFLERQARAFQNTILDPKKSETGLRDAHKKVNIPRNTNYESDLYEAKTGNNGFEYVYQKDEKGRKIRIL